MPKLPIDLSRSDMCMTEPCPMSTKDMEHYPSLHLEWNDDYQLPESGEMTVKFRKVSETNSKHGGKSRQSVTLDIISIEEVKKGKVKSSDEDEEEYDKEESSADRLDKMAEEASEEEGD